jgi:hypothetical protein
MSSTFGGLASNTFHFNMNWKDLARVSSSSEGNAQDFSSASRKEPCPKPQRQDTGRQTHEKGEKRGVDAGRVKKKESYPAAPMKSAGLSSAPGLSSSPGMSSSHGREEG